MLNPSDLLSWWRLGNTHGEVEALESYHLNLCRYGEHVLESNENPNWICPVCRGICNCSLCRTAKGWPPTGPLYKKVFLSTMTAMPDKFLQNGV